jgi:recombination protein RecT
MSTAVAKRDAIQEVCTAIADQAFVAKIKQANPVGVDRFVRTTLTAIQQNPDVVTKGDRGSLYNSVIRAAQDGLLPDGREAAFVLFGSTVSYMPMVQGLRKIAAEYGFSLTAYVVYEHDTFSYQLGFEPEVTHVPPTLSEARGDAIGAYAVAAGPDGKHYLDVMSKQEIEHVRESSRSKGSGPWVQHWGEMARKTVARRLWKQLPFGAVDQRTASVIEASDAEYEFTPGPLEALPQIDVTAHEYEQVEGEVVDDTATVPFGDAA